MARYISPGRFYDDQPIGLYARVPSLSDQRQLTRISTPMIADSPWQIKFLISQPNDAAYKLQELVNGLTPIISGLGGGSRLLKANYANGELVFDVVLINRPFYAQKTQDLIKSYLPRYNLLILDSQIFSVAEQQPMSLGSGGPSESILSSRSMSWAVESGRPYLRDVKIRV